MCTVLTECVCLDHVKLPSRVQIYLIACIIVVVVVVVVVRRLAVSRGVRGVVVCKQRLVSHAYLDHAY